MWARAQGELGCTGTQGPSKSTELKFYTEPFVNFSKWTVVTSQQAQNIGGLSFWQKKNVFKLERKKQFSVRAREASRWWGRVFVCPRDLGVLLSGSRRNLNCMETSPKVSTGPSLLF